MGCFGDKPPHVQHCKVVLLDDTDLIQAIQANSKAKDLLDVVFKHLNLLETAYFGLRYVDGQGQTHWLDPCKETLRQLKVANTFTLYFGVKFYAADPCKLLEEITRYQFFLQVKQDILHGRLPVSFELAAELFAYALQSELGDYDSRQHLPGYANEFSFVPNQTSDLVNRAAEFHKTLTGKVPAAAEMCFLDRVKWLDMYGVDLHPVMGRDNVEYFLGLSPSGLVVLRNKVKVGNYFWPRITKITFKGKFFMLRVKDKNNEESTYGFELPSKQACKHLWKCSVEHHAFFRLTQVQEIPRNHGKFFSFGSRFRYSGRTQKQIEAEFRVPPRPPPSVVRVPSRRYHRRIGQPDGADAATFSKEESGNNKDGRTGWQSTISIPQPVQPPSAMYRSTSVPTFSDSPKSTRSMPWENSKQRGLYSQSANPSPKSVRSCGSQPRHRRGSSNDSDHGSETRRRRRHRCRRSSDNESDTSRCSRSSRHGCRHRCSHQESGSDSDIQHKQNRRNRRLSSHSHHHQHQPRSESPHLIEEETQWQEVSYVTQPRATSAVVRDLSSHKSGYINSGIDTESEAVHHHRQHSRKQRRRSRSRSKSPDSMKAIPEELKKHIVYNLVESSDLTEEEKRAIQYTKVEGENRLFRIRYSPSASRPKYKVSKVPARPEELHTATKVVLPRLISSEAHRVSPTSNGMSTPDDQRERSSPKVLTSNLKTPLAHSEVALDEYSTLHESRNRSIHHTSGASPKVSFQKNVYVARGARGPNSPDILHRSQSAHEMSTEL